MTRAFPLPLLALPLAVDVHPRRPRRHRRSGLALVHTTLALPFAVLITFSLFSGIPVELEEAAWTLGCTRLSAFRKVVLPLALPGIAASARLRLRHLLERGLRRRRPHHPEPHADRLPAAVASTSRRCPAVRRRRRAGRAGADLHLRRPQVPLRDVGHRQPIGAAPMAEIRIKNVAKRFGSLHRAARDRPDHPRPGVPGAARRLGLRQDHAAQDHRRARDATEGEVWIGDRRVDHLPRATAASHGVPELRGVPAPDRLREHRLRPADGQAAEARGRAPGRRHRRAHAHRAAARALLGPALRRPAPARRRRPRARDGARRDPDGRAALQPRRPAPPRDARRAQGRARRVEDHDDLRHPRPGRGDVASPTVSRS